MGGAETPLAGRKGLVIGAGTQVGRAAAAALAAAGADVAVAAGSLDGDEVMAVRRTRRAIESLGRRSAEYAFDLNLGQNVRVSTRQVAKEMGGLDALVYAADAFATSPTERMSDADWHRLLNVNLNGVFYACRGALGEMKERGGSIVVVSSVLGERGVAECAAYCAARHGVAGLVRAIAAEFRGRSVRINAIALGWLSLSDPSVLGAVAPEGGPEAAGRLAVYLASDAAALINGQILSIDGAPAAQM
jgi:NAD(P)-dependent dehydrogenase (short-subunit alcohol dehydrogenase family)